MNLLLKISTNYLLKPFLKLYLRKERTYNYKGFKLVVFPGVFHPGFFFSTKFLADFVSTLDLKNKKFCEPGTGSGLVSLFALKKGALVTAFDINPIAIKNSKKNFETNRSLFDSRAYFEACTSDLFDVIEKQTFDYIVVNPPYFFADAKDNKAKAWYAGKEGEYFEKFFRQLKLYIHDTSKVYMILADNCEIGRIETIASKYGFKIHLVKSKKIWWEENSIFEIGSGHIV
jgi:release factor glutamine methyltransferase